MTKKFFGTDGIRGKTGSFPITPDFFVKIGDSIKSGDPIFRCFNSNKRRLDRASKNLLKTINIGSEKINHQLFINS